MASLASLGTLFLGWLRKESTCSLSGQNTWSRTRLALFVYLLDLRGIGACAEQVFVLRLTAMLHIILFNPEIPQNTGNIGRLCAITESRLHLIHPLGFTITDKHLKRSGMDYWNSLDVHHHENWEAFELSPLAPKRLWLLTTHADHAYWDVNYADGDGLVFGSEGHGAPDWLHTKMQGQRLTIPHKNDRLRSLNLSTSVGIVTYEALRQLR